MKYVKFLHYSRARATLLFRVEEPSNLCWHRFSCFLFFLSSMLFFDVFGYRDAFLFVFLFAIKESPSVLSSVVFISQADATKLSTRRTDTLLAFRDVGAQRALDLSSPITTPLTRNPNTENSFSFFTWPTGLQKLLLFLSPWFFRRAFSSIRPGQMECSLRVVTFWFLLHVESLCFFFVLFLFRLDHAMFRSTHASGISCYT